MASHTEIKVGSVGEWVCRVDGQDVPLQILEKIKSDGRGYEFRVRRVGLDGVPYGRTLERGSGSLRRPGTAARAFGGARPGANPKPPAPAVRPAAARTAPVRAAAPVPARSVATPPPRTFAPKAAPAPASSLTSLRGTRPPTPPRRPATPKPVAPEAPSQLADKVIKAIRSTDGSSYQIRNVVAQTLAQHEHEQVYGAFRRS